MVIPSTVAFRTDEGLIYGQGRLWIKALGVSTVIVASNSANEDIVQQTLMKAAVPKTIAMCFLSIRHTCDVIMKTSPGQTILIVCKTPEDAPKLATGGAPVKEISVGNIHRAPGKKEVNKYIASGNEDKTALKQLRNTCGVVSDIRTTASGDDGAVRVDLNKYL